jgi:hypothetical protein
MVHFDHGTGVLPHPFDSASAVPRAADPARGRIACQPFEVRITGCLIVRSEPRPLLAWAAQKRDLYQSSAKPPIMRERRSVGGHRIAWPTMGKSRRVYWRERRE